MEFSLNLSAIYTKWCAQTFPSIFGLFAIFDHIFAKIMAPSSNENANYVVHLKERSIPKRGRKPHQNRPINRHTILVWTMSPTRRQTRRDIQKKHRFSLLQPARVVRSPQTLHADREHRDNSKRWQSFFDSTHSFSCRGENADFWPLTHWVNLIPAGCHSNLPVKKLQWTVRVAIQQGVCQVTYARRSTQRKRNFFCERPLLVRLAQKRSLQSAVRHCSFFCALALSTKCLHCRLATRKNPTSHLNDVIEQWVMTSYVG